MKMNKTVKRHARHRRRSNYIEPMRMSHEKTLLEEEIAPKTERSNSVDRKHLRRNNLTFKSLESEETEV